MDETKKQQWNKFWKVLKENGYEKVERKLIPERKKMKSLYQSVIGDMNWLHYYKQNQKNKEQLRDGLIKYLRLK